MVIGWRWCEHVRRATQTACQLFQVLFSALVRATMRIASPRILDEGLHPRVSAPMIALMDTMASNWHCGLCLLRGTNVAVNLVASGQAVSLVARLVKKVLLVNNVNKLAILMLANAMAPHPKVLSTCAVPILALDPIGTTTIVNQRRSLAK